VYAKLKAAGLAADAGTCACFMACCEKDARWAEAKAAFEEMKAAGVEAPPAACAVYETALARLAGDHGAKVREGLVAHSHRRWWEGVS
jgi:pentatricopeptide repeat protein